MDKDFVKITKDGATMEVKKELVKYYVSSGWTVIEDSINLDFTKIR